MAETTDPAKGSDVQSSFSTQSPNNLEQGSTLSDTTNNATTPASAPPKYSAISSSRQTCILILVTLAGSIGPLSGTMYLPVLPLLAHEFDVSSTSINASVSVFMMTFAFAPLFWASFSDYRGRRPIYIMSLAVFVISNLILAAIPPNFPAFMVLRFVHAFGAGAVVSMGAGTVADITEPKKRGSKMSIFLLGPQCGPVFGPVVGSALGGGVNWRWIPGFLTLFSFTIWLLIIFLLPETLRFRVGNGMRYQSTGWLLWPPRFAATPVDETERGPRPPKPTLLGYWKLFSYPPIGIVSVNTAILYSTYFAITIALPYALDQTYHWSSTTTGLGFLAVGIALMVGTLVGGRVNDWNRARRIKAAPDVPFPPESRLNDQFWGVLVCVAGTVMFGWFIQNSVHVAAAIVATFLAGFGMSWVFVATTAFLGECVPLQAAGAFALGNMLRNPAAAIAAVIYPSLKSNMGIGWFFTGFAILDLVVVGGTVLILRCYGPYWRKKKDAARESAK
ncbi:hypothetical protein VHEMI01023 [[Torrubiella] hemipterigena]|uniref:Major facilitator superfamily (MFS) profile domain-containing protein n=1 Tax=[Torrubiella] hemipterigena TaxID=1531966 RepID=A0A0A1SKT1_9HYPO|nr:hypothetical protein VHEMI01023 [[Torrubiella] hemipterigena]